MNTRSIDAHGAKSPSGSPTAPVVFVVDDDVSVRESLKSLFDFVGIRSECFASAKDFLARPRSPIPSCLLLDVNLPDVNGLDFQEQVVADRADMPIIFITGYADVPMTVRAMKAGAVEFLTKPLNDDVLLSAIERAFERSRVVLESEATLLPLRERYANLSPREREIMALVVSGLLNKQIGGELGITEITVKAHRGSVMRKMEASSLPSLVSMAAMLRSPAHTNSLAPRVRQDMAAAQRAATQSFVFGPFVLVPGQKLLLKNGLAVRVGGRALDLLTVLVNRAGVLVSKADLLGSVWPSTVVEEGNLNVNMAALRRVLGDVPDVPTYIATVAGKGYRFIARVQASDHTGLLLGPDSVAISRGHGLPPRTTRIIGRDAAIDRIRHALNESRLVSIVGAGGIGKTTVAVAVAQTVENEQEASVTFVDLARVASEEFVPAALMAALGISSLGGDSVQAVVSILARRKALVLLDTCEHVLGAVTHIASAILQMTTGVRILVTSRQVLGMPEEKVEWLGPLEVPPPEEPVTADQVLQFSAPQLLLNRATENTVYRFQDSDAPAIVEICRRLDAAPLAIELVSARFSCRSAESVLDELDQRFSILRRDSPGGPLRQRTLLATLEWSYSLLTTIEASVLRCLSIFAGAFDMDAVVSIVAPGEFALADTFEAISGLRSKSMLSLDQTTGQMRYRLLDTTRAFASNLLASQRELIAVSARHARLQLAILNRADADQAALPSREWRTTFGDLADDLRKALNWALYRSGDSILGIQLVAAGLPLWRELSLEEEVRRNCEMALAEFARIQYTDMALKLKLLVSLASASTYGSAHPEVAVDLFRSAIQLAQELGDSHAECHALSALSTYTLLPSRQIDPRDSLERLRLAATHSNDRLALWEYEHLSVSWESIQGHFAAHHWRLEKLHSEIRDFDEGHMPRFQVYQKNSVEVQLAAACWYVGRPGEATLRMDQAVQNAISTSHGLTLIHCLSRGAIWLMIACRDYTRARLYSELLKHTIVRDGVSTLVRLADLYSEVVDVFSGVHRSPDILRLVFDNFWKPTVHFRDHWHIATLADAMLAIGQVADAARALEVAFREGPAAWCLPELLRVRAGAERAVGRNADAQETLRESLRLAEEKNLLSWQLRSARDLALLLKDQGAPDEGRRILAPIFGQFIDGFDTGDLRDCRDLLAQLG